MTDSLRAARAAARRLARAQEERDAAILAARPAHSLREIAEAVGLSKARVQQIVDAAR